MQQLQTDLEAADLEQGLVDEEFLRKVRMHPLPVVAFLVIVALLVVVAYLVVDKRLERAVLLPSGASSRPTVLGVAFSQDLFFSLAVMLKVIPFCGWR